MKDVQNQTAPFPYYIPFVGIEGIKSYVTINWKNNKYHLLCSFNVYIDLPPDQKGIHMSRNSEAIYETIEYVTHLEHASLEDLLYDLVQRLANKHDYAEYITVELSTELPITTHTPISNKQTQEIIPIKIFVDGRKNGDKLELSKTLVIEVTGQTVCPCAQELTKEQLNSNTLSPSHNQRGKMVIEIQTPFDYPITFEELYEIANMSMSAPTYSLLKRADECYVVIQAHQNPRFVEDCVRHAKYLILKLLEQKQRNDYVWFKVQQTNFESIHKHNAVAIIIGEYYGCE